MKLFSLFAIIIFSWSCWAQVLGMRSLVVLDDLEKQGIFRIGDLDLSKLRQEMQEIRWEVSSLAPPKSIAGGRRSAFYILSEKKIVMSESNSDLLETHEALGVLGYRDQNYSQTSALDILRKIRDEKTRQQLIDTYGKTVFKKENLKATGGSSVGGGGDSIALEIKSRLIANIIQSGVQVDISFFEQYPEINFEPLITRENQMVGIEYQFSPHREDNIRGAREDKQYQELFTVYFPALMWDKEKKQAAILHDIKRKILSVFPISSNTQLSERKWGGICRRDISIVYPVDIDPSMAIIQAMRTATLTGCFSHNTYSVKTPGL